MKNSRHEIQKSTLSKNGRKLLPAVLVTNLLVGAIRSIRKSNEST